MLFRFVVMLAHNTELYDVLRHVHDLVCPPLRIPLNSNRQFQHFRRQDLHPPLQSVDHVWLGIFEEPNFSSISDRSLLLSP